MNIQDAKVAVLRFLYAIKAVMYRMRGVRIGRRSFISGFPFIKKCRGAQIIIGNDVTLHSKKKYNPLMTHRITLAAVTPEAKIEFADNSGASGCTIICANHISIGRYTILGAGCTLYDCKEHEYSPVTGWFGCRKKTGAPIRIGSRCYIGMNCIILKGVTIGDNCVISAGTIIKEDVPAGHLAQGNPAVYTPLPERLTRVED